MVNKISSQLELMCSSKILFVWIPIILSSSSFLPFLNRYFISVRLYVYAIYGHIAIIIQVNLFLQTSLSHSSSSFLFSLPFRSLFSIVYLSILQQHGPISLPEHKRELSAVGSNNFQTLTPLLFTLRFAMAALGPAGWPSRWTEFKKLSTLPRTTGCSFKLRKKTTIFP